MRVLICPDKFAGSVTAGQAAAAIAAGWRAVRPGDLLETRPLSDGGPGFLDMLDAALDGKHVPVATVDPLGRPVGGEILVDDRVAYLESAQAVGLAALAASERDPRTASSYGLGALVLAAIDAGAAEIVIGLGGSAVNDGGAGLLRALGVTPLDADGRPLPLGAAPLARCAAVVGAPKTAGVRLIGATDVDNPLTGVLGASAVYGPQKGASRDDVPALDAALERFARVLADGLPTCPPDLAARPGAGAAGGLGAAILALGGELRSGLGLARELTRLDQALDAADAVITGEGSLDAQSLRGKVVAGVANAARDRGIACFALVGQCSVRRREREAAGIAGAYTLVDLLGSPERAMREAGSGLSELAARLARSWGR